MQFISFPKNRVECRGHIFAVDPRYIVKSHVGQGAQGVICSAHDVHLAVDIAIKKLPNALDEVMSCKRLLRELRIMRRMRHENLLQVRDIMLPPSSNVLLWRDLYMVTDLMDTDMHYVISSGQELSDDHIQYFMFQLLSGLAHLHACNVVHRDLKPSNLLVDRNCDLRICDFGMARTCAAPNSAAVHDDEQMLTLYVATRWYRAPELLCLSHSYGAAVDLWSTGCILAEMILRAPLMVGNDYLNQLQLIIQTLGTPTDAEMATLENEHARQYVRRLPEQKAKSWEEVMPHATPAARALLRKLLVFDQAKRLTAAQALHDEYVSSYLEADDEAGLEQAVQATSADMFDMANVSALPKEQLQNLIFQEMLHFHPEMIAVNWGACAPSPT